MGAIPPDLRFERRKIILFVLHKNNPSINPAVAKKQKTKKKKMQVMQPKEKVVLATWNLRPAKRNLSKQ